jgi:transposase
VKPPHALRCDLSRLKTKAQQTLSVLHSMRESLVRDRTNTINQLHGFLLEFGISLPLGRTVIKRLPSVLAEHELPIRLNKLLQRLHAHFGYLDEQITQLDKQMAGQRAIEMGDGKQFGCGRDFAASIGLVPRQYSTGGRSNLKGISKRGDISLRCLLVQCARVYMQRLDSQKGALADWVRSLLQRRHSTVVACALANKLARIARAISAHHTMFEAGSDATAA